MKGGPSGDLYVDVNIRRHPIFKWEGSNLYCEAPISFTKAALGGTIEVPTIDGAVKLTIPTETQSGEVLDLKEKGSSLIEIGLWVIYSVIFK